MTSRRDLRRRSRGRRSSGVTISSAPSPRAAWMVPITRRPWEDFGLDSMSVNVRGRLSGFTPRVVRVRNRCLQSIARRRSLPVPRQADLEKIGDQVALSEAIASWEAAHQPEKPKPRGGFELPPRPRARWRSPALIKSAAVVIAALMGILAGRQLLPRADAQLSDGIVERPWLIVSDSVADRVNNAVYRVTDDNRRTELTAADVAALIFRSPRRRTVFVDSI